MPRISQTYPMLIAIAMAVCVAGARANAAGGADPFFNDKSPECQFLAGAWEGYRAGLTASADPNLADKTSVAVWFHRLQQGVCANVYAYENLQQEYSDTAEHQAIFRQVDQVARLIEEAFVKRFSSPTRFHSYEGRPERKERPKE